MRIGEVEDFSVYASLRFLSAHIVRLRRVVHQEKLQF